MHERQPNVLIVGTDNQLAEAIGRRLRSDGYCTSTLVNDHRLSDELAKSPSIVLADLRGCSLVGMELLHRLSNARNDADTDTKTIVCCASRNMEREALKAGVTRVVFTNDRHPKTIVHAVQATFQEPAELNFSQAWRSDTAHSLRAPFRLQPPSSKQRSRSMTHRRILIVDDDRQISDGVGIRLRAAGYDTLIVDDGVQGVSAARRQHPDAIVLDVRMPNMDGLSALAELKLREDTKEIPIIMLSASVVDEAAALDGGARYFVRKPFAGRSLVDAVDAATSETT